MLHPAIVVLILALEAVPLFGSERIPLMVDTSVTIVPSIGALNKICNSNVDLFGCTAFRELLSCSCHQILEQWRLDVSVRVTPSIYLWKVGYLGHENDHIGDIRVAVQQYMHDLGEQGYPSLEECRDAAQRETDGFHHLMDTFKEDSNAKRHPFYHRRLSAVPKNAP